MNRSVVKSIRGQEVVEGAGVRVRRTLGTRALDSLDPFLLLDEFKSDRASDYIAGFPDHPHRGFETVTYMLAGSMEHRDHRGNHGHLVAGSVQWMTAGRGIIHSEMPKQEDGLMWGFQLWVNLPAKDKMCEPRYQDLPPERIPEVKRPGSRVRVVAGEYAGTSGPVQGVVTRPLYLDVGLSEGGRFEQPVAPEHTAFAYVFEGEAEMGGSESEPGLMMGAGELAVLGEGDRVRAVAAASPARFLLLAAKPIGEPVARYGPFVMNTQAEIRQALRDYQQGTLAT